MLVPRGTPGVRYEQPISKIGHRLCQNNTMVFENCRVPEENVFAQGDGDLIIAKDFTWSGPVAAIAAVGVARSAYEYVLKWAKTNSHGSDKPIIHYQAVGYKLASIAMRIEASVPSLGKRHTILTSMTLKATLLAPWRRSSARKRCFSRCSKLCRSWE